MRVHRFAVSTALATYVLLIVGGLVHATGSSLACPDWPLCHGSLMPEMVNGVEFEHSHRLVAGTVAIMTCVLAVLVARDRAQRALRPLAFVAPLLVLAQAVLGGLTVLFKLPRAITLSHLTLSMIFFSTTLVLALRSRPGAGATALPAALAGEQRLVGATALAALAQITLGGLVRHSMAGLACTTFPFCFGAAWPAESAAERIHMLHRYGAVLVALLVVVTAVRVHRRAAGQRAIRALCVAAPVLVLIQGTLGVLSVTSLLHRPTVIAHLGVGALLLGTLVCAWTLLRQPAVRAVRADAPSRAPGAEVPA